MDVVWLVWDRQHLNGMFEDLADAKHRQTKARDELGVVSADDPRGWPVRIEPWAIGPPSKPHRPRQAGQQRTQALDLVDRDWGLLAIPEMGTGHFIWLDTYLVVPHRNRLTCPAFQFDGSRELWPGFRDVLKVLRGAAWDDFSICMWFVSRQGSAVDGPVPALLIRDDPDRVLRAARRAVER